MGITILIVDAERIFAEAVAAELDAEQDLTVVATAARLVTKIWRTQDVPTSCCSTRICRGRPEFPVRGPD